jgi:hypothetical protein
MTSHHLGIVPGPVREQRRAMHWNLPFGYRTDKKSLGESFAIPDLSPGFAPIDISAAVEQDLEERFSL